MSIRHARTKFPVWVISKQPCWDYEQDYVLIRYDTSSNEKVNSAGFFIFKKEIAIAKTANWVQALTLDMSPLNQIQALSVYLGLLRQSPPLLMGSLSIPSQLQLRQKKKQEKKKRKEKKREETNKQTNKNTERYLNSSVR